MPGIPENKNDTLISQHQGIIHLAFGVDTIKEVDEKAQQLRDEGFKILSGPGKTGDGYYEFETLDPDNNRVEVTSLYPAQVRENNTPAYLLSTRNVRGIIM